MANRSPRQRSTRSLSHRSMRNVRCAQQTMKYTAADLKTIDALDYIRSHPEMFTPSGFPSPAIIAHEIAGDAIVLGATCVKVFRYDDWWIVSANVDCCLYRVDVPHLHATHSIRCLVSPNYPSMLYVTRFWRPHMLNASSHYPNPIASSFVEMLPIVTRYGHACLMELMSARLPCEWWTPFRACRKIAITVQCTRVAGRAFFQ